MKHLFSIITVFLIISISHAQDWEQCGNGLDDYVTDMIEFNGELYVGGRFNGEVKSWDGSSWTNYSSLFGIAFPLSLSILNDTLYVGGDYPWQGSQSRVYRLVNGNWEQVGGYFDEASWSSTKTLLTHDSILISGGRFSSIDGVPIKNVAYWNGTTWNPMGAGLNGMVTELSLHNNTVYATGGFTASGSNTSVSKIAKWDGSDWQNFDPNVQFSSAGEMISFDGDLIVGDVWDTINAIEMNGIARWDGTNYSSMGDTLIDYVNDFWVFNSELYMAATIKNGTQWGTDKVVMKWDGAQWIQLGSEFNQFTVCLGDYNGMLYCGGTFTSPANHIARYNPVLEVEEHSISENKYLVKVMDLMGREIEEAPNTLLLYMYSDGTTEKIFRVE